MRMIQLAGYRLLVRVLECYSGARLLSIQDLAAHIHAPTESVQVASLNSPVWIVSCTWSRHLVHRYSECHC